MEVNRQNIDAVIAGLTRALNIIKQKEMGYQKVLEQTTAPEISIDKFLRSLTPLLNAELQSTIAELESLKVQLAQLMQIKQKMESNIVVPEMVPQQADGPKIIMG